MDWRKVIIYTTTEGIEAVSALLLEAGINGFCVEDSNDFKEFLESATPNWDYVDESLEYLNDCETNISFYLADNEQGKSQYDEIAAALVKLKVFDKANEYGRLTTEVECVNEDDWANNWKQYFKPLKVGEKLLIKPSNIIPKNAKLVTIIIPVTMKYFFTILRFISRRLALLKLFYLKLISYAPYRL